MAEANGATVPNPPVQAESQPPAKLTWDQLRGRVKQANGGDAKDLPRLREALESGDYRNWSRWLRETHGNPAEWLKCSLARSAGGKDSLATIEAAEEKMKEVRPELKGPSPTPIERLLAERAAVCWFTVNLYETIHAQATDMTIRQADYQLRKIDSANRRFLAALATLARVSKLALPALQVNIGANQVNVSQASG
jgi:hypothetical protein